MMSGGLEESYTVHKHIFRHTHVVVGTVIKCMNGKQGIHYLYLASVITFLFLHTRKVCQLNRDFHNDDENS